MMPDYTPKTYAIYIGWFRALGPPKINRLPQYHTIADFPSYLQPLGTNRNPIPRSASQPIFATGFGITPWPRETILHERCDNSHIQFLCWPVRVPGNLPSSPWHPLAQYPGPVLARLSKWWMAYWIGRGNRHSLIQQRVKRTLLSL
ncbi:hypothetical protein BD779DRAFT_1525505, partial [Infundibulicybe gibba]